MKRQLETNYSYKLSISIVPYWARIYESLCGSKLEWGKKIKEKKIDYFNRLSDIHYCVFNEYYDSSSGLLQKFQQIKKNSGETSINLVDEFKVMGYVFDSDDPSNIPYPKGGSKKEKEEYDKEQEKLLDNSLAVEIGENYIRKNIFDRVIGDYNTMPEKEDLIVYFPSRDMFEFLFIIGQRFHFEKCIVEKWPDEIENKFLELGIKYKATGKYTEKLRLFDIEKEDKEFFNKVGRPKISFDNGTYFMESKNGATYGLNLQLFWPNNNTRIMGIM